MRTQLQVDGKLHVELKQPVKFLMSLLLCQSNGYEHGMPCLAVFDSIWLPSSSLSSTQGRHTPH